MNLGHLRHLVAVAEHQSYRKAAEALFLTQPALSRSIQALEDELEVPLFEGRGRQVQLTAIGEQVVRSARRVLFEARELERRLDLLKNAEQGDIRVGFGAGPAAVLETDFIKFMVLNHPGVRLKVSRGSIGLLLSALRNESVDILAVDRRAMIPAEDLQIDVLPPLRGGFACRAGHPLLAESSVDLEMLRRYPVASSPLSDEIARNLVAELGPAAHPDRLMTIQSLDVRGLIEVVETTDAVLFAIYAGARESLASGRLCELQVRPHVERAGHFALVSLAGRCEAPAVRLFRDFVRDIFHD